MMADEKKVLRLLKTARGQIGASLRWWRRTATASTYPSSSWPPRPFSTAPTEILAAHLKHSVQEAASDAERGQQIDEFVSTLGRILK